MNISLSPKDVLRAVAVALLAAMALGSLAILVVVAAGKLGVELLPTVEMRLFIATTAWYSLVSWTVTVFGFGAAAVQLVRKAPGALWAWTAGFVSAAVVQLIETATARSAGADPDPSGYGVLVGLALLGWAVFTLEKPPRRPPALPAPPSSGRRNP